MLANVIRKELEQIFCQFDSKLEAADEVRRVFSSRDPPRTETLGPRPPPPETLGPGPLPPETLSPTLTQDSHPLAGAGCLHSITWVVAPGSRSSHWGHGPSPGAMGGSLGKKPSGMGGIWE